MTGELMRRSTVKELIAALQQCEQNARVVMSKDGEGNSFSPLSEVETGLYVSETTWMGEFISPDDDGDKEVDLDAGEPAVALWPVN